MRMTGTTGIKNFINKYKKRPSSNKMSDHLKNLSQVYLEQIAESAVPVDEADMSGAPSIKDAKPAKKTKVKYDPHMKVMAPQVEKEEVEQVDENRAAMGRINKEIIERKKQMRWQQKKLILRLKGFAKTKRKNDKNV